MTEKEAIGLIRAYSSSKKVIESIHKEIEEYKKDIESLNSIAKSNKETVQGTCASLRRSGMTVCRAERVRLTRRRRLPPR